jgi:predicted flap endonuclease-1-like 5' DNA nuclease
MTTDLFFSLACLVSLASFFGLAMVFAGYKLFRILLPIWGFFFGFFFGAQTIQVLFDVGFLETVTSWVVGFIVGMIFAVLAYPFYLFAVGFIAASLGYLLVFGLWLWLRLPFGFWMWLTAIVVAFALVAATYLLKLQKWVIVVASAVLGAGIIVGAISILFRPHTLFLENPIGVILDASPLLLILFLLLVLFGIIVQVRTTREAKAEVLPEPTRRTEVPPAATSVVAPTTAAVGAAGVVAVSEAMKEPVPAEPAAPENIPPMVPPADTAATLEPEILPTLDVDEKLKSNLEYIEGIGHVYASKLNANGINDLGDLLEKGAYPKGRDEIAAAAGISPALVLTWVNHVDLFRIKGVGSEYADLLERAGVDTVVELSMRNPDNLYAKMVSVNEEKKLVRRLPVLSQVQDWVEQAKLLPRKINY